MLRATSQFRASDRLLEEQIEFYEAVRPVRRRARCYLHTYDLPARELTHSDEHVRLSLAPVLVSGYTYRGNINRPVSQVTYDVP
jgi:hypothetical protein